MIGMVIRSQWSRVVWGIALVAVCSCSSETVTPVPDLGVEQPPPVPPEDPPLPRVAVLNEIHYAPADKTSREEFIELVSVSDSALDLSGWRLTGGVDYTFPAGTTLAPGAYLVIAENPAVLAARFPGVRALGPFAGGLSSSGDTIILRDELSRRRDEVSYGRGFPWPTGGGDGGYSIEKINPSLDGKHGGSWRLSTASGPTPAARNARYDDNAPPLIDNVAHRPLTPRTGEAVTVTARIRVNEKFSTVVACLNSGGLIWAGYPRLSVGLSTFNRTAVGQGPGYLSVRRGSIR